jgi:hypothetical protein
MADDLSMWWRTPLSYAPSEFTTADEMRLERGSQRFGRDLNAPIWPQFRERLPLLLQMMPTRSPLGARIGTDHAWASQTPSAILYPELGTSLAKRYPFAFRDRARAPFAEPPQLPASNNNRPFLRREDQAVNPYDFAAAWQQAMRQRLIPGGRD